MNPPEKYSLESWNSDYAWFCAESHRLGPHSARIGIMEFRSYFIAIRADALVAEYCLKRFVPAMEYLESNISALSFGPFAVEGSDQFLVHRHVISTLYRFYAARPNHAIEDIVPIEDFIEELKESF